MAFPSKAQTDLQALGVVLVVSVPDQTLTFYQQGEVLHRWPISTSEFGVGSKQNSQQTPLGWHRVAQKIGDGAPINTRFIARKQTTEIVPPILDQSRAPGDYVTTRILWLEGMEPDANQGPGVDSFQRFIYIHGTPEEGRIGAPASHGCIRMRNADVVDLFNQVSEGTLVYIAPDSLP